LLGQLPDKKFSQYFFFQCDTTQREFFSSNYEFRDDMKKKTLYTHQNSSVTNPYNVTTHCLTLSNSPHFSTPRRAVACVPELPSVRVCVCERLIFGKIFTSFSRSVLCFRKNEILWTHEICLFVIFLFVQTIISSSAGHGTVWLGSDGKCGCVAEPLRSQHWVVWCVVL
jgi:hypothetical protein